MRPAVLALPALVLSACAPRGTELTASVPDPAWDAVFTSAENRFGWTGGDIAHSIDLRDGRVLWLFGDSLFGQVAGGKRIGDGAKMQRAAIAWHPHPEGGVPPARPPEFAGPEAFDGALQAAWTQPEAGVKAAFGGGAWYWLMNDGVRVPSGKFVLFVTALGPAGNPDGMWNFRRVGGAMLEVESPGERPDTWRVSTRVNPLVTADAKFGERPRSVPGFNHALAILEREETAGKVLYLYGVRYGNQGGPGGGSKSLIVARATPRTLMDTASWRFFDGKGWSERQESAAIIAETVSDEFTVQSVRGVGVGVGEGVGGRDVLVLVHGDAFLGRRIMARTALRPEGPWSEPKGIAEVTDAGEGVMVYAAKGHAALSRPGELLVSTATNSDFGKVFADASLYRPKFFRVPLSLLPEAP